MDYVLQTFSNNVNLNHNEIISIIVNISIFILILIGCITMFFIFKKQDKGYKLLFIFYLIFWIPIFLGRDFRSKMNTAIYDDMSLNAGVNMIDSTVTTMVMIGYGLVGIFARIFADYFSYLFRFRKAFLYLAILINIGTFIPIVVTQTPATNIIQVVGVGISASCIGTVELLFKSNYKTKTFATISILSIPPLLANFLTAPIQSIVSTAAKFKLAEKTYSNPQILSYLWIIGLAFLLLALVLLIFIKEKKMERSYEGLKNVYLFKQENKKSTLSYFIIVSLLGCLVMFIKFSNSGAMGLNHLKVLSDSTSTNYEGYLSVVFSLAQLLGGVLIGVVLTKKWNINYIFLLGSGVWIIYLLSTIFIRNQYAYFVIHSLNGFAYGILYNLLLGLILSISLNTKKITSMGIYQSICSIGIMCSGWFNTWMKEILPQIKTGTSFDFEYYFHNNTIVNSVLIGVNVFMIITFFSLSLYLSKYDKEFYNKHLIAKDKLSKMNIG